MAEITKQQLVRLAEEKLADAELLLNAGRHSNAYYLAGYAAELLLKAIISKRFSADTIPDRRLVNAVHTHNLRELVAHAGLDVPLA
jgi:HEPN domain-containing protein